MRRHRQFPVHLNGNSDWLAKNANQQIDYLSHDCVGHGFVGPLAVFFEYIKNNKPTTSITF